MSEKAYPRDLAVRVLTRVLSNHEPLDEALALVCTESRTGARPWLQEVCAGTLRWKGRLDQAIDSVALKKKPTGWLRKILLIAAYQLIGQERTSPAAVVSETVSEIKKKEGEAPARFGNALLRKISDHSLEWRTLSFPEKGSLERRAAWAGIPEWLWKKIEKQRGVDWARAYALASFERPTMWIRSRQSSEELSSWAQPGPLPGSFSLTEGGALTAKPGFERGDFFVQDISSQWLIHEISREVSKELHRETSTKDLTALDLCAAPGGKSVALAWEGFKVNATDLAGPRVALLKQTIERMGSLISTIEREKIGALPAQDLVWVDAPCTGSGILRRHPDVRWLRREKDLDSLTRSQKALLREGWEKVRPGGFLVYSVCSVLDEEGPEVISGSGILVRAVKEWRLSPQEAPFGDGFWCALFQKAK